ncbi:hypothetical protein VitviT2T_000865 [Vitis vinifera]|uniref:Glycine-rich protein n=2 Tax=Vitis vinifera TaxID=29760 RepID=A0ABY9BEM5_VITVI|nr:uncharacterized protein LOC100248339 [Vitis vinifera]WJZ81002.1 hypothetical protein VitviT2T_000865 [Vitis vinifera]|eukprot:XP_002269144.1 PREDICTED: uncharacterized protein LOC100248339 [Vitis vinifera]
MAASDVTDGPVLSLINKRLRGLRKKYNRITQMEEAIAQGKPINKEQEDVLRSKPAVTVLIDELERLRQPLSAAVEEELSLALQSNHLPPSPPPQPSSIINKDGADDGEEKPESDHLNVENLLNLLYFGYLFDVKPQTDFTSTMLTRTHERGCCLTYDYVTDDATDLLGERDLDLISQLSGLLISRPVDSSLSHKNALQRCIEHARLWLANSDRPIEPDATVTYAGLREKLNKIMASDYFTTTPEMKAPVEVAAAAAAGNYVSFQVPLHSSVVPVQVEGSIAQYQQKDEDNSNVQGHETGDDQSSPVEELHQDELEIENPAEVVSVQQEQAKQQAEVEWSQGDVESKEQYVPRRNYQNTRGGRGGGGSGRRGGYPNGRGGRSGGRVGGSYQNGRSQYYDQPGNYYSRGYHNNRGRGGRGAGGNSYNNHVLGIQGGHAPTEVGLGS